MTFRNLFIDEVSLMTQEKNEQMQGAHMITLNDYLYSGDTVFKILKKVRT